MKTYYVKVGWMKPFPKSKDGVYKGSAFHVAISKALRDWRRANARQVIKKITVEATLLSDAKIKS